jgi:hypothetical protein
MSDTEINQAIAEACGWTGVMYRVVGVAPDFRELTVPDYGNDLNAISSPVSKLSSDDYRKFLNYLSSITGAGGQSITWRSCRKMIEASAAQRAEAFLRTLGKWKDA